MRKNKEKFAAMLLSAVLIIASLAAPGVTAAQASSLFDNPAEDTTTEAPATTEEPADTGEPETDAPGTTATETEIAAEAIMFTVSQYTLGIGESVTLEVVVAPDGAELPELTYSSSDPETVSVSKAGKVTALKSGKATVTARNSDGSLSCECSITATSSGLRLETIANTGMKIVSGLTVGMTAGDVIAEISIMEDIDKELISVKTASGDAAASGASIATGMTVDVNGAVYTAILYGDINGDGVINAEDTRGVTEYVTGKDTLTTEAQLMAADVLHNGGITIENALVIQRHIYGFATITQ